MVLKCRKFGVNSGNTFKNTKPKLRRQYLKQAGIVRYQLGESKCHIDPFKSLNLDSDGVFYSLNKKNRWCMPKFMINEILNEMLGDETQVTLLELHKLNKTSNCDGLFVNRGKGVPRYSRKHKYLNATSVLNALHNKRSTRCSRKRKQTCTPINDQTNMAKNEVQYHVLYPAPADSYVTFSPKYMKTFITDEGSHRNEDLSRKGKRSRARRHVEREMQDSIETESLYDYDLMFEDENEKFNNNVRMDVETTEKYTIHQLIDKALKKEEANCCMKRKVRHKSSSPVNKDRKCRSPYISDARDVQHIVERGPDGIGASFHEVRANVQQLNFNSPVDQKLRGGSTLIEDTTSSLSSFSREIKQIRLIIPSILVKPDSLHAKYGRQYTEATCKPRRFIIEITNLVYEELNKTSLLSGKAHQFDLNSFVIFSFDGVYDTGMDIFNVSLQIDVNSFFLKMRGVKELQDYSVDEILTKSVRSICLIPVEEYKPNPKLDVGRTSISVLSEYENLKKVVGWKTTSFMPPIVESDVLNVSNENIEYNNLNWYSCAFRGGDAECCGICFGSIDPFLFDSSTSACLQECGHWFCDNCWRKYLITQIETGRINLTCPQMDCGAAVDMSTLMTIVPLRFARMHLKCVTNFKSYGTSDVKWCPNTGCGRVVRLDKSGTSKHDPVIMACQCGLEFCFRCLKGPHWPVHCDKLYNYEQNMIKCGDENIIPFLRNPITIAQVKKCPSCGRCVEKAGGCNIVTCICTWVFCWACMKSPSTHLDGCRRIDDDTNTNRIYFTEIKVIEYEEDQVKSKFYEKAVAWRQHRVPRKVWKVKKFGQTLLNNLRKFHRQSPDEVEEQLPTLSKTTGMGYNTTTVENIIKFIIESLFILEFTAVFMDNEPTPNRQLHKIYKDFEGWILAMITILSDTNPTNPAGQVNRLHFSQKHANNILKKLVSNVSDYDIVQL